VIEISADHCFISPTGKHDFRNRNSCHHCDMPAAWVNGRECGS
jgi:hypothetical protein